MRIAAERTAAAHTHLMAIEPYADTDLNDNDGNATPDIEVILDKVPVGKHLVVEHISGQLGVKDGGEVDWISANAQGLPGESFTCQCGLYHV